MKKSIENILMNCLNVLILISSIVIISSISIQILLFQNYNPENSRLYILQLIVCSIFLLDFLIRLIFTNQKRFKFLFKNIFLLIFSIPYLNIVNHFNITVSPHHYFLLNLIPLLRSAFAFTILLRWIYGRGTSTLLVAYLSFLVVFLYVSSLIFFVAEKNINPDVTTWYDSIWWASMDLVTVGSNIIAVTAIGKILSVILACLGMMMLPIFTVYITDKISKRIHNSKTEQSPAQ